jgi:hypothetical protein
VRIGWLPPSSLHCRSWNRADASLLRANRCSGLGLGQFNAWERGRVLLACCGGTAGFLPALSAPYARITIYYRVNPYL